MDLSKLSDAELDALFRQTQAKQANPLAGLSDAELDALAASKGPAPDATASQTIGRAGGLAGRASMTGILAGWGTPGALVIDAAKGVGRDVAFQGKKLLSKTGAVEAPDPKNYWPGGDREGSTFEVTEKWNKFARKPADAIGLPEPATPGERLASAGIEGVAGAASGAGVGAALRLGPAAVQGVSRFLRANPVLQTVAGGAGGVAGQGAVEAGAGGAAAPAGIAAGILTPLLGRGAVRTAGRASDALVGTNFVPRPVTSSTAAGQRSIAGEILRGRAADPNAALGNLDTYAPRIAGWQHTGVAAARDPGLAAIDERLAAYSKLHNASGPAEMHRNNSTILSNALDQLGARGGSAAEARRAANTAATADRTALDLRNRPNIDITHVIDDLEGQNLRSGQNQATAASAEDLRTRLIQASEPIRHTHPNGTTEIVGYTINPDNLHVARKDIGEAIKPTTASRGATERGGSGGVQYDKGFARRYQRLIDDELTAAVGPEYTEFNATQRAMRSETDQRQFMADLADEVNASGRHYETGARDIDMGRFARRAAEKNVDRPLPGGVKTMSIQRLEELRDAQPNQNMNLAGMRADLIRRASEDINTGTYAKRGGSGSQGSNTRYETDVEGVIGRRVMEGRGVGARAASAILGLGDLGTYGATRFGQAAGGPMVSGATNFALRAATGGIRRVLGAGAETSVENVQRALGQAHRDPAFMAQLMREAPLRTPAVRPYLADLGTRNLRYGVQGGIAGDRRSRYR